MAKRKRPRTSALGDKLSLLCYSQISRVGFSIPVVVIFVGLPKRGKRKDSAMVMVTTPDGEILQVTEADLTTRNHGLN